ncbi:AraC family transcriptional regulator [Prevotella sp. A2931]|uniref:AraC family transcriptional regulator n=1 Tax=Prevotella illustrans TaxID=2800387 RepID=A0ABS3M222_9BACT|nr:MULTISPECIES: helix-turn-helix domain-containing protein [Prevotella]MBO1362194.1 AraC family transcriptional regulator [Prevotella illustrans]PTL26532.1 AraC family transcriptional regulator [Prevotella sp. oral taxon 820]
MNSNDIETIDIESALRLYRGSHIDNDLLLIDEVADIPLPGESRRMKSLLIALCLKGKAQYTVDTIEYKVKPNDIMIISNGQVVDDYLLSRDCSGIAIMVSYDFYREIVSDVHELSSLFIFSRNHPVVTLSQDESDMIQEYYRSLKSKVEDQSHHFRREVARSLLSTVIYDISNSLYHIMNTENVKQTRADKIFKEFIQLVEANYHEKRRVGWYGGQLCISPKYLSETIKAISHQTPNEWIDRYVVLEICNLLRNTTKSIKEIAQDLHFPTQSFLGKYFKEHVGVSPTEYRRG